MKEYLDGVARMEIGWAAAIAQTLTNLSEDITAQSLDDDTSLSVEITTETLPLDPVSLPPQQTGTKPKHDPSKAPVVTHRQEQSATKVKMLYGAAIDSEDSMV